MPYLVSPRCVDHKIGPKPTKKSVTRRPERFAVMKWPNSCPITINKMRKMTSGNAQPTNHVRSPTKAITPTKSASGDWRRGTEFMATS